MMVLSFFSCDQFLNLVLGCHCYVCFFLNKNLIGMLTQIFAYELRLHCFLTNFHLNAGVYTSNGK